MEVSGAWGQVVAMSPWEYVAVLLSIAYLLLAARENIWCWLCALVSTCIYVLLFWNESLLMESALNGYYIAMAVYGWWQWRGKSAKTDLATFSEESSPQTPLIQAEARSAGCPSLQALVKEFLATETHYPLASNEQETNDNNLAPKEEPQ